MIDLLAPRPARLSKSDIERHQATTDMRHRTAIDPTTFLAAVETQCDHAADESP